MARDLPYLKFNAAEYLNGEITLEDFYTQGVFINICALYWFKSGCLTLAEIKRRLKCKQSSIDRLIETNIVKVSEDHVQITFLDEQLHERGNVSKINSINGSLGGAPKGNSNARKAENNKQETTEKQPKTTNIEENRREERRTEQNKEETAIAEVLVWPTFLDFWDKYDKKVGKPKAEILFKKINQGAREKIMQHLDEYLLVEKQFRKDPERYLKAEAWNNEVIIKQPIKNGNEFNPQTTLDRLNGYGK